MSKRLTKEAFLEGKPFYKADNKELALEVGLFYKHRPKLTDASFDCVIECASVKFNKWHYHSSVGAITDEYVILYTTICGQYVDKKIYFQEYNIVEEEPADGTN